MLQRNRRRGRPLPAQGCSPTRMFPHPRAPARVGASAAAGARSLPAHTSQIYFKEDLFQDSFLLQARFAAKRTCFCLVPFLNPLIPSPRPNPQHRHSRATSSEPPRPFRAAHVASVDFPAGGARLLAPRRARARGHTRRAPSKAFR